VKGETVDLQSTSDLVKQMQNGSLEALGNLYNRYNQMVYRTAYAITGDADAAADLLQDVFLRLHRYAARIDTRRPLEPWLYRMTANLSYTWVKRRRWLRPLDDVAEWIAGEKRNLLQHQAELNDERHQIQKAISSLPLQQRLVIVFYYINDLSLQEIADILEVPVGTVKSRLFYGRKSLKKMLGPQGEEILAEARYEFT
jgi:RNA polymerase sigma-70 factor (ECF subfamily)